MDHVAVRSRNDRRSVSFIYHFFPHYRAGVIKELNARCCSEFVGDRFGLEGIKSYDFACGEKFVSARCYYMGRIQIQPRVLVYCATSHRDVFVFLGNPNNLTVWLGTLLCKVRGKRVILWGHGYKSDSLNFSNKIRRFLFSMADGFYTYGWRAKVNAIKLGEADNRVYVGFNSLNYDVQLPIRQRLIAQATPQKRMKDMLNIFCISRLTSLCRYDMLLDAMALAAPLGVRCAVTFVGDGIERSRLEQQAMRLCLEARFLGEMYEESRIAQLLFEADVTVSPGKVGLTAMHSLMYGTPVITNDNFVTQMPEVEAVVPGITGDFFADGSTGDLAKALVSFSHRFPDKDQTRARCFLMIDQFYNPRKQCDVMLRAINGEPADRGDDAFVMFDKVDK